MILRAEPGSRIGSPACRTSIPGVYHIPVPGIYKAETTVSEVVFVKSVNAYGRKPYA